MLSPFRFHADMKSRSDALLWELGIQFPLERLHHLIHTDTWSDADSERAWNAKYPRTPYQMWNSNPIQGGTLKVQDIRFICPWCNVENTIPLRPFADMHCKKSEQCTCRNCGKKFNADVLSVKLLKLDMSEFLTYRNAWYCPFNF